MRVIEIPEELSTYIELLHYEVNALQDLLVRIATSQDTIPESLSNHWTNRYIEKYMEYDLAKQNLEKKYVIPTLEENEKVNWSLNFESHEVVIQ